MHKFQDIHRYSRELFYTESDKQLHNLVFVTFKQLNDRSIEAVPMPGKYSPFLKFLEIQAYNVTMVSFMSCKYRGLVCVFLS